jgi:hypothetical protein
MGKLNRAYGGAVESHTRASRALWGTEFIVTACFGQGLLPGFWYTHKSKG